jgi:acyl carrier protein
MSTENIPAGIQIAVAEALGLDEDEVTADATLLGDLGAESIDLLDILFRIERQVGVKVEAGDMGEYIQGGIPDDEFGDEDGIITAAGLAQLEKVMPQIDASELAGKLEAEQIMGLFTVANLVQLVESVASPALA